MEGDSVLFRGVTLLSPSGALRAQQVRYCGGRILSVASGLSPERGERVVEGEGDWLLPLVLDLHVHGGGGFSFLCEGEDLGVNVANVRLACKAQFFGGTGWLLATLPLSSPEAWHRSLEAIEKAIEQQRVEGLAEARIEGVYLEGPFLNPQMAGGMEGEIVSLWSFPLFEDLLERFKGLVKVVTLAPEHPLSERLLSLAERCGARVFLGHSSATFQQASRAFELGASGVTHLFNAMAPYHHREPGIVGASLLSRVPCEMVAEPSHLHSASWQLAVKLKGENGVVAVSDGSPLACGREEVMSWMGERLERSGTASTREDGRLCGTAVSLLQGLALLSRKGGLPLHQGMRMATENPSRLLGLRLSPFLARGYRGPVALLRMGFEVPEVEVFV